MTTTDPGSEITTREQRAELAVLDSAFVEAYPALDTEVDIRALMEETMGPGGSIRLANLTRIKVPPSELKSWMIPDDNGDDTAVKAIKGIPVSLQSRRSFWTSDDPTGSPPECRSGDLIHGKGEFGPGSERNPTGLCAKCPMSQRGSAGKGTQASKCKEQRVIFMLTGDLLPIMVVIPAGSLPNFANFGAFMFRKAIRGVPRGRADDGTPITSSAWLRLEVEIGLERDTNPNGQEYNKATFKVVRRLTPDEVKAVNDYGLWVDTLAVEQADEFGDAVDGVAAEPEEEVPFDPDGMPVDEVDLDGAANGAANGKATAGSKSR